VAKSRGAKLCLIIAVVCAVGAVAAYFAPRVFYANFGYLALGFQESRVPPEQVAAIRHGLGRLKGRVVWSSSRSGNHEIYLMRLPQLTITRLTRNDYVDFYPRFSPGGKRIVFARSQKPWVSERRYDPWDVYLLDLATGRERLVVRNANFPVWAGPDRILFIRGRKVILRELTTGREEVILDGGADPVDAAISTPELSPADPNLLAFTGRGKMNGVFVAHLGQKTFTKIAGGACELTWFPDGRRLAWIGGGGRGKTRVMVSALDPVSPSQLIDLPGTFSHEYFPRLSRDGRWLLWAASAGGHEHDIADYELFLWRLDRPASEAMRLTFNRANDRWPDIFIDR